MPEKLTLDIRSGAMIGQRIEVTETELSLGGKGSSAGLVVSGVTYGVEVLELRQERGRWLLEEITTGLVRVNGKRPGRRNVLRSGDVFVLPGVRQDEPIEVEVILEKIKTGSAVPIDIDLSGIKPQWVAIGLFYAVMLIGAGLVLSADDDAGIRVARADVGETLRGEIAAAELTSVDGVLFAPTPTRFDDVLVVMASTLPPEVKQAYVDAFVVQIESRFAEARRLSDLGLDREAADLYRDLVEMLQHGDLDTTITALRELAAVSGGGT